jgi:hypothetical protein
MLLWSKWNVARNLFNLYFRFLYCKQRLWKWCLLFRIVLIWKWCRMLRNGCILRIKDLQSKCNGQYYDLHAHRKLKPLLEQWSMRVWCELHLWRLWRVYKSRRKLYEQFSMLIWAFLHSRHMRRTFEWSYYRHLHWCRSSTRAHRRRYPLLT